MQAAAFKSAEVLSVAASENAEAVSTETKTEKGEIVDNTVTDSPVASEVVETPEAEASPNSNRRSLYDSKSRTYDFSTISKSLNQSRNG